MTSVHDWISLSAFLYTIKDERSPYRYLSNPEQTMVNMLASRTVPVRAMVEGQSASYRRIEACLTHSMNYWISTDRINTGVGAIDVGIGAIGGFALPRANNRPVICERVQLDRTIGEAWLNANALEDWMSADSDEPSKQTKAAETKMGQWLGDQPSSPVRRKEDVWTNRASERVLGKLGPRLSRKAFERAWKKSAPESWKRPGPKKNCPAFPTDE
jgi:hypothetical protein